MTEYDSFKNGLDTLLMDENHSSELNEGSDKATPSVSSSAHLDAERGVFITSKGDEFQLTGKQINRLFLIQIVNEGKPKIPRKEVLLLGKHKELQANPHDPDYLAELAEWKEEQLIRSFRYLFNVGIKGQPPQEFVDTQRQFQPNATDLDLKYMWVLSILPEEDIMALNEAIIGQTLTTTEGLESAANFSK